MPCLQSLLHLSLKILGERNPPSGSPCSAPIERDALFTEPPSSVSQNHRWEEPTSRFPLQSSHRERCPVYRAFFISIKILGERSPPPGFPCRAPIKRDALFTEPSSSVSPRWEEPTSRFPLQSSHKERCPIYRAFFICLSSVRGAHLQVSNENRLKTLVPKACFYLFLGYPNKQGLLIK